MEDEDPNSGFHDCAVNCVSTKPGPRASVPTVGLFKIERWDAVTEESGEVSVSIPLLHLISPYSLSLGLSFLLFPLSRKVSLAG